MLEPNHYFMTMGEHPPVRRIAPGDTVETSTVDAIGQDAGLQTVAGRPNPQTRPFVIERAERGDAASML